MNTEHTNQSSQAEPASHSPIGLQSIPKRQRDFTAENIRDIAHECMRIGDNEQAEVIFAIADALRDGNLTIHPAAVAVRIRELEAQLNAAILARQEAQQIAQEAIEARNRAGVEIRRPLLKRIRELQAQQAEPVNQQLLALVKNFGHKTGCAKNAFGEQCTCGADEVIAAAEQAPQAEPVAWHTNDPCVSSEHIEAIAKVCKIIPSYTTVEYVDRIVGFGHVLLADKSVQEAFVRANSHLLRTDAAQPPAVSVPQEAADSIRSPFNACCNKEHCRAMLAAAPQATAEDSSVVGDAVAVPTIKLGLYGRAFDTPQTRRAYTYQHQPDNLDAYNLGRAAASTSPGGDNIDRGLSLLKELQAHGFGVFELGDQQKGGA